MKILHVTKKYPNSLGGDAVVVSNLEKQQIISGNTVSILTSNCNEIIDGPTICKFGFNDTSAALDTITPRRLFSLIMLFFTAFRVLRKFKPDIIHTHSIDMAFFVSFAARFYNIPIVHTFHIVTFNNPRVSGIRGKIELLLLRGASPKKSFVLNPSDITDFKAAGFNNVEFVPNGVNIEDWQMVVSKPKKNKIFTFIAVGRLEEQKGFTYLIDAAKELRKSNKEFQIQIVGEGSLQRELNHLINKYEIEDNVVLLGRKNPHELKELYADADVFVLSSLWEGMPLSLLEAWAAGLPTIATEISCIPYIARDISVLVPAADKFSLSLAMANLINKPRYRKKLSNAGAKAVREEYRWSIISKHLYDKVVA